MGRRGAIGSGVGVFVGVLAFEVATDRDLSRLPSDWVKRTVEGFVHVWRGLEGQGLPPLPLLFIGFCALAAILWGAWQMDPIVNIRRYRRMYPDDE